MAGEQSTSFAAGKNKSETPVELKTKSEDTQNCGEDKMVGDEPAIIDNSIASLTVNFDIQENLDEFLKDKKLEIAENPSSSKKIPVTDSIKVESNLPSITEPAEQTSSTNISETEKEFPNCDET